MVLEADDSQWRGGSEGRGEGLSKKEKGLMDMDNGVVTGGEGVRRLNGNGKNTIRINLKMALEML